MKRLLAIWQAIRYSLWIIPSLVVMFAIVSAIGAIFVDESVKAEVLSEWPRVFTGSAEAARATLEVVASAMITIAALTFSITMLVLSSVASQYTPRIIRTFMSSTLTKTVLGVFVGIYVYCLIVLRTVSSDPEFVPSIAVTIALLLALVGVGFLIAFIHHIATSIQVSVVVSTLAKETMDAIDNLYPDRAADTPTLQDSACTDEEKACCHGVPPQTAGYVQTIDYEGLARFAHEHQLMLKIEKVVGQFVMRGEPLVSANRPLDEQNDGHLARRICSHIAIGPHRTIAQDIGAGIRQLADIALRAISPAVNDTNTASTSVDYLTAVLARLATRQLDSKVDCWKEQRTLFVHKVGFLAYLRLAFELIRLHAGDDLAIYLRLLHALRVIGRAARDPAHREAVLHEARLVMQYAQARLSHADELARIEQTWQQLVQALDDKVQDKTQDKARPQPNGQAHD